jgi:hypothetical protein
MKLKVKIQMVVDAQSYINKYIEEYSKTTDKIIQVIEERLPQVLKCDPIKY